MATQPPPAFAGRPSDEALPKPVGPGLFNESRPAPAPQAAQETRVHAKAWPLNDVVQYLAPALQAVWPQVFVGATQMMPYQVGGFAGIIIAGHYAIGQFAQPGGGFVWGTGFANPGPEGADVRVTLASAPTPDADTALQQLVGAYAAAQAKVALRPLYAQGRAIR